MNTNQGKSQKSLTRGLIYGGGAAFVGALVWAAIALITGSVFIMGAIVIGFIVAYAVFIGSGESSKYALWTTFVLTIGSVLLGDFFFILLLLIGVTGELFNFELIVLVFVNFIEFETGGIASFIFAIIGATSAVFYLRKVIHSGIYVDGILEDYSIETLDKSMYYALVLISYSVEGVNYKIMVNEAQQYYDYLEAVEQYISKKYIERDIKVYYNAKNPQQARVVSVPPATNRRMDHSHNRILEE